MSQVTIRLETPPLVLRAFQDNKMPFLADCCDLKVAKYHSLNAPYAKAEAIAFIELDLLQKSLTPHTQPLLTCLLRGLGAGRQSYALAGWGS
ncbi:MAG: hypothetical protein KME50_20490 [Nostoc desertorum CM1-VF14]|jgi:hypothetical protein|nr:hypothetical protein [Nostoc desertorum CM1-VF14]